MYFFTIWMFDFFELGKKFILFNARYFADTEGIFALPINWLHRNV